MKELTIKALYQDLNQTMAKETLESKEYPWEVLPLIHDMILEIGKTLSEVGISSEYIQLEVTESAAKENKEIFPLIQELKNNGHKILLDDFGTGYSSLMSLEEIKFDTLKLDKSFVDAIGSERGEKLIVYTIQLAKSLGMEITAEGVETEEQYQFLKENECSNIQGYYFAKPMPAKEFEKLLREQMKKEGQ